MRQSDLSDYLGCPFMVAFFGWGIVGIAASYSFLIDVWGWPSLLASLVTFAALIYFPVLFAPLAFFGALYAWDWHWFWALLLAAPGLGLAIILMLGGGLLGTLQKLRRSPDR